MNSKFILSKFANLFFLCLISVDLSAKSRVLVISDIDDTIKISHIHSKTDSAANAFFNYKSFLGMPELYDLILQNSDANIYYVSNAPTFLMHSNHAKFLKKFNYPQSNNLITRDNSNDNQFKVKTILNLVQAEGPETLILIGDNGEADPQTINKVMESLKNSSTKVISFIHFLYSKTIEGGKLPPLPEGIHPYITPIEIALYLTLENLFTQQVFTNFSQDLTPKILASEKAKGASTLTFPKWMACSGFSWNHPSFQNEPESIKDLKIYVTQKCSSNKGTPSFLAAASAIN